MTAPEGPAGLSDAGRILVEAAEAEARGMGHEFVGLEHLLLALLADPSLTADWTGDLPDRAQLRQQLAGLPTPRRIPGDEHGLSPQARRLLAGAEEEGRRAGLPGPDRRWLLQRILTSPRGPLGRLLSPGASAEPQPEQEKRKEPEKRKEANAGSQAEPKRKERGREERPRKDRRAEARERRQPDRPQRGAPPAEPRPASRARDESHDERPAPRVAIGKPPPRRIPWRLILLAAVPISVVLNLIHAHPLAIFATACLAVIPLAGLMGEATEHLATRTGPAVGGLLNATFGNAAELIIAFVALRAGLVDLVKASITGSILGNLLLIMGLSFLAGGAGRSMVSFNRVSAGASAGMLALAVVGLVFPALVHGLHPEVGARSELYLSEVVAIVLALTYACSLWFSLRTHRSLFGGDPHPTLGEGWSPGLSVAVLGLATAGVVVESEILVHSVEAVTATLGWSEVFLGLIIVPIIGNAAEHAAAVVVARKGQMDLSLQIALGSSTQVALLVAPLLVLAGVLLGQPMNLVFTPFEVAALGLTTIITAIITLDGEMHWFEGVQLLATYALVAATAFFL